jgi:uncharacterized peroxidase-related enzyme
MARIEPLSVETAQGESKELLTGVKKSMGMVPNLLGALAQSPAALNAYLNLSSALGSGSLSPALREQIALALAGENGCQYCASAHTMLGKNAGVAQDELGLNLKGESSDQKTAAALTFVRAVIRAKGHVSDAEFKAVKSAGFSDGDIAEIIGAIALNTLTNFFNHVADTDIDFPKVDLPAA